MNKYQRARLARNQESVKLALIEAWKSGTLGGGSPHKPMRAVRNLSPKDGFNTKRCTGRNTK